MAFDDGLKKKKHKKMLQPSSRLEWEYSCVCVCLCPAQKCAFLTKIYIKEKLPHNDNTHTHTAVGTQDIRFFQRDFSPSTWHILFRIWWCDDNDNCFIIIIMNSFDC